MGFLKNFSEPFAFALALWPFVSMLLMVPVLALLYHTATIASDCRRP